MQGSELKALRKNAGLNQAQLGEVLGISGPYVGELERGEKVIDRRMALAARRVLERDEPDDFLARWLELKDGVDHRLALLRAGKMRTFEGPKLSSDTTVVSIKQAEQELASIERLLERYRGRQQIAPSDVCEQIAGDGQR